MTHQQPLTTAQDPTALPPFTAKLRAHGETRRVRLSRDIDWADFDKQIRSTFPHLADTNAHYTVTYHDDDDDEISLSTTEELREALATNEQLCNPKCLTFAIVSDDMSDSDSASIASWRASVVSGPLLVPADEADAMDVDSSPFKPNKTVRPEEVPLPPSPAMSPAPVDPPTVSASSAPTVTVNINTQPTSKDEDVLQAAMDAMDEGEDESAQYPPARASTPAAGPSNQQENVVRIHISSGANNDSTTATAKAKAKATPTNGSPTRATRPTRGCPYTKSAHRRVMDPFSAPFFGMPESDHEADSSDGETMDPMTELLAAMGVIPPQHQLRPARKASPVAQAQAQAAAREHARRQGAAAELARRRAAHQAQLEREATLRRRQQEQREREAAIRRAQAEREAALRAAAMERERRFRIAQERAAQEATARRIQAEREAAYWAQQERIARQRAAAAAQARSRGPCAGAFVPSFVTDDEVPRFAIHPGWSW